MGLVSNWLETAQEVVRNPEGFFEYEDRRSGFDYPLRFAFLSLVTASIISAAGALIFGFGPATVEGGIAAALTTLIAGPIFGLIGLFIGAAVVHLFVYFLGGEHSYGRTFAVAAYATALSPIAALVGLIPLVGGILGLIVGLYGICIQIRGLEEFQKMTTGQAAAAVILPAVIIAAIAAVLAIIVLSFLTLGGIMAA